MLSLDGYLTIKGSHKSPSAIRIAESAANCLINISCLNNPRLEIV
ncbi:hypothetical protein V5T82_16915 [Magnetovibrio sp. PR-2]